MSGRVDIDTGGRSVAAWHRDEDPAAGGVPEPHGAVDAGADELGAVRAELHGGGGAVVPAQHGRCPASEVPDPDRAVSTSANDAAPSGVEVGRRDCALVADQDLRSLTGTPHADGPVRAATNDGRTVR